MHSVQIIVAGTDKIGVVVVEHENTTTTSEKFRSKPNTVTKHWEHQLYNGMSARHVHVDERQGFQFRTEIAAQICYINDSDSYRSNHLKITTYWDSSKGRRSTDQEEAADIAEIRHRYVNRRLCRRQ